MFTRDSLTDRTIFLSTDPKFVYFIMNTLLKPALQLWTRVVIRHPQQKNVNADTKYWVEPGLLQQFLNVVRWNIQKDDKFKAFSTRNTERLRM